MVSLLCIRREPFSQFGKERPLLVFRCSRHFCSLLLYILKRKDWKSFCVNFFFVSSIFEKKKGGFSSCSKNGSTFFRKTFCGTLPNIAESIFYLYTTAVILFFVEKSISFAAMAQLFLRKKYCFSFSFYTVYFVAQ